MYDKTHQVVAYLEENNKYGSRGLKMYTAAVRDSIVQSLPPNTVSAAATDNVSSIGLTLEEPPPAKAPNYRQIIPGTQDSPNSESGIRTSARASCASGRTARIAVRDSRLRRTHRKRKQTCSPSEDADSEDASDATQEDLSTAGGTNTSQNVLEQRERSPAPETTGVQDRAPTPPTQEHVAQTQVHLQLYRVVVGHTS
jgi:hypothetical protein